MQTVPLPERKTISVEEAAALLGVGRSTAYAAVRSGAIPSVRIRRRVVVPREAIDRLLTVPTPVTPGAAVQSVEAARS